MDTSCAIALAQDLNRPDLIEKIAGLGYDVELPRAVQIELLSDDTRERIKAIVGVTFLPKEIDGEDAIKARYPFLGDGEVSVMARAQQLEAEGKSYTCVLDDGNARKVAKKLKLEMTGTLGLLQRLEQRGILTSDARKALIEELRARNFRMPKDA